MKKFKKLTFLGLTALTLFGCGNDTEGSSSAQVELTVWGDADNQAVHEPAFTKLNEEFQKQNPDIKLNYQFSGTLESINIALQSDSLPDLFWVQGNKSTMMQEMAKNDYLLPIEGLDYSRFPKDSIDYATVDGEIYSSLPSFVSYVTFFYNEDVFKENNIEAPETWEEFETVVDTLLENDVIPIAAGGNGDFDRYWYMQATGAALASEDINSIVEDKENATFDQLHEVFANYTEYSEKNAFGKDFRSTDGTGAQLMFTNGNAAMIADGTWNNATYEESGINVGTFALAGKDGKKYAQTGPSNINTYAISSNTEHPEAAKKYVEFLNSLEAQQIIADETGEVPSLDDIEPKDESVAELASFDEIGANIYNKFSQAATESSKPQDLLLTTLLPELMQGNITADEAVKMLQAELEK